MLDSGTQLSFWKKGYGEQNHRIYTFKSNFLFKGSAAIPFIARIVSADAMMLTRFAFISLGKHINNQLQ